MGLKDTIQKAAQTALKVVDDITVSVTFESVGSTSYDASSGIPTSTDSGHMVSMIFGAYSQQEIVQHQLRPTDVKATIAQLDLPVTPKMDDEVWNVVANVTVAYDVVNIGKDPADAIWVLGLRKR